MCTSKMIIEGGASAKAPSPDGDGEWVNPVIIAHDGSEFVDFSGVSETDQEDLNCAGWWWNGADLKGLTVLTSSDSGNPVVFWGNTCNQSLKAACCK
jgi:hypothetical protein